MPFVKQENRTKLDRVVSFMVHNDVKPNGDLHYVLYRFAKYHVEHRYGPLKEFIGELRLAADYIEHEFLWPREDVARKENGDV